MKHTSATPPRRESHRQPSRRPEKWGLRPSAARLVLVGQFLILAALCDFAIRLHIRETAGAVGSILLMENIGGSLSASAVILWAAALGLEYLERTCPPRDSSLR